MAQKNKATFTDFHGHELTSGEVLERMRNFSDVYVVTRNGKWRQYQAHELKEEHPRGFKYENVDMRKVAKLEQLAHDHEQRIAELEKQQEDTSDEWPQRIRQTLGEKGIRLANNAHTIDIVIEKDGQSYQFECDWVKDVVREAFAKGMKQQEDTSDEWPQSGDEYFFVNGHGIVFSEHWRADSFDRDQYKRGNVFRTREEAEAAAERVSEALNGNQYIV